MSTVIVAEARTPFGRLERFAASAVSTWGAIAIKGALRRRRARFPEVQYATGAGAHRRRRVDARQTAIKAGIGWDVPALSINKMCLSGIDAIAAG